MSAPTDTPLDQAAIFAALAYYYPDGFEGFDPAAPSPTSYAEYLAWCQGEPLTLDEVIAGARETFARRARNAEIRQARADLAAQWAALPYPYIRGPYRGAFDSAVGLLDERDYDGAAALIAYAAPAPDFDAEQLAVFASVKATFAAAILAIKTLSTSPS